MFLNNAMDDRKPQAGALVFGGKKWVENLFEIPTSDPLARIPKKNLKEGRLFSPRGSHRPLPPPDCHTQCTPLGHRLNRINGEIPKDLFHLIRIHRGN
jgi:hypothetical protein